MFSPAETTQTILQAATDAGFELAGIAPVEDGPELRLFPAWIEAGHAGEMKYLEARNEQGRLKRASLANVAPWARSVVVCAINYNTAQPYSTNVSGENAKSRGWISRYAWSHQDYHESVMQRIRKVEIAVIDAADEDVTTRCYVDTGPIVERVVAKYAGIGWIGKNTCLINQKMGSWLFLGVILTSMELKTGLPAPDRCGSCTRCIEACPTDALIAPYQLDSNKCISYLTIEKRGAIAEDLRDGMGRHLFGCDICQDVCPWNRKAPATDKAEFQPRPELVNPALEWLAEMTEEQFRHTFRGSPIRRAKRTGLRRNAVIAMGNSGQRKFIPALERLAQHSASSNNDEEEQDEVIAEAAVWAAKKLKS